MNAPYQVPTPAAGVTAVLSHIPEPLGVEMTGQYLHQASQKRHLFFRGPNEVPRSLTIIAAMATKPKNGELDMSRNGVVIIDNDNWRVLADGIARQATGVAGASREQIEVLDAIGSMNWSEFTAFCRNQVGYRPGSPDIDDVNALPASGHHENQALLGLRNPKLEDYRNDFIRSLNELGEYALPLTSRKGMISDLMMRASTTTGEGRFLHWSLSMNYRWDRRGYADSKNASEVNPEFDGRWAKAMEEDPKILERACKQAFAPYVSENFNVFELEDEASCNLVLGGENADHLLLASYKGRDMSFRDFRELRTKLEELQGDDLTYLWTTARVLDKDLNRERRAMDVTPYLNDARAALEMEWAMEVDEEIVFHA